MAGFDPYSTLGVGKEATPDEVKKAYRNLARKYHPDHNPNDHSAEEKFKEVKKAYDILSDPGKRQQYDSFGFTGDEQPGAGGFSGFGDGGYGFNFGDIFETMFGDGFGRSSSQTRSRQGADVSVNVSLTFEEAVFGSEKEVAARVMATCEECQGTGAKNGTEHRQCPQCQGSGRIQTVQNTILGRIVQPRVCPKCNGTGTEILQSCANCRGQGRVEATTRKKINIPPGVDTGTRLRVSGAGHAGSNGAPPGDLYIQIAVGKHEYFERKGQHIHLKVPIGLAQAAMGVELDIPTIDGTKRLQVPGGTESGTIFRFNGKGVPNLNRGGRGDQIITVDIEVPKRLTPEQKDALRKYAKASGETVENIDNSLAARLKRVFGGR